MGGADTSKALAGTLLHSFSLACLKLDLSPQPRSLEFRILSRTKALSRQHQETACARYPPNRASGSADVFRLFLSAGLDKASYGPCQWQQGNPVPSFRLALDLRGLGGRSEGVTPLKAGDP